MLLPRALHPSPNKLDKQASSKQATHDDADFGKKKGSWERVGPRAKLRICSPTHALFKTRTPQQTPSQAPAAGHASEGGTLAGEHLPYAPMCPHPIVNVVNDVVIPSPSPAPMTQLRDA